MKIVKIKYEKLFPVGAYLNEKIGFEADLSTITNIDTMETTSEDPKVAIEQLRQLAEEAHKEKYPHLYDQTFIQPSEPLRVEMPTTFTQRPKSEEQISREQQIEGYKQIIDMATTKKMLELHRPGIVRMEDSALTAAFNNKINQLQ